MSRNLTKIFVILLLVFSTSVVYWQTRDHEFVSFDDGRLITENRHVQSGLNLENIKWAFTDAETDYWHPLTWLSLMLDCELYGLNPAAHHVTDLAFHIANAVLLFALFNRMTGAAWRSAFVAALFALHPLNVESVAWAAERKSVLSAFFFILAILTYIKYVEHPGFRWYSTTLVIFVLGLMSKPTLVILPFILMLLDYWPLDRLQGTKLPVLEKIPFLVLGVIMGVVTVMAHKSIGVLVSLESLSLKMRVMNAVVYYAQYIRKAFWPVNLAVFYPYTGSSAGIFLICAFLLLSITFLVALLSRQHKYLAVGWLWYLITLGPMVGLIQAGGQSIADRFAYVPITGLFIMSVWGLHDLLARWKYRDVALSFSGCSLLLILSIATWNQLRYWRSSLTLFGHAVEVIPDNYLAENNLGLALSKQGKIREGMIHFSRAIEMRPDNYYPAYWNMGYALTALRRYEEAMPFFLKALDINPLSPEAHNLLGSCLFDLGKTSEAIAHYSEAVRIKPDFADAHYNLGVASAKAGRPEEAADHYRIALKLRPSVEAYYNLGLVLISQGKYDDAVALSRASEGDPRFRQAGTNIKIALERTRGAR